MEGPAQLKPPQEQQEPLGGDERLRREFHGPPLRVPAQAKEWANRVGSLLKEVPESEPGPAIAALAEGLPGVSPLQRQELAREIRSRAAAQILIGATREWPSPLAERFCFEVGRLGPTPGVLTAAEALVRCATSAALLALEGIAERSDLRADQRLGVQNALTVARKAPRPEGQDDWLLGLSDEPENSRVTEVLQELGNLSGRPLLDQYLALRLLGLRHGSTTAPPSPAVHEADAERLSQTNPRLWNLSRLGAWSADLLSWFLVRVLEQETDFGPLLELVDSFEDGETPHRRVIAKLQDLTREDLTDPRAKAAHRSRAVTAATFLLQRRLHDEELPVRLARWWASLGADRSAAARRAELDAVTASLRKGEFRRFWFELSAELRKDVLTSLAPERLEEAADAETSLERRALSRLDLLESFWSRGATPSSLERLTWQVVMEELKRDQLSQVVLDRCGVFLARAHLERRFGEASLEVLTPDRLREDAEMLLGWMLGRSGAVRRVETLTRWLEHRPAADLFVERLARELEDISVPLEVAGAVVDRLDAKSAGALHGRLREAQKRLDREKVSLEARLATSAERAEVEFADALEPILIRLRDQMEGAPNLQAVLEQRMKALRPDAAPPNEEATEGTEMTVEDLRAFLTSRWKKWTGLPLPDLTPFASAPGAVQILLAQLVEMPDRDEILRDVGNELAKVCRMAGTAEPRRVQAVALARILAETSPAFRRALAATEEVPPDFQDLLHQETSTEAESAHDGPDLLEDLRLLQDRRSAVDALLRQQDELSLRARRRAARALGQATEEFEDFICHYLEFRRNLRGLGLEPVAEDLLGRRVRAELPAGFRILHDGETESQVFEVRSMGLKVRDDLEVAVPSLLVPVRGS